LIICPRPLNTSTCGATSVNICYISVLFWLSPERHFITHDYFPSGHSWAVGCFILRCIIVAGRKCNQSRSKWQRGNLTVGRSCRDASSSWRVRRRILCFRYYLKLIVYRKNYIIRSASLIPDYLNESRSNFKCSSTFKNCLELLNF
jgi:hypothetical protein